jgi:hypothetical protein
MGGTPDWAAAEDRGPLMHAHIGMLTALNRHVEREFSHRAKTRIGEARSLRAIDDSSAALNGVKITSPGSTINLQRRHQA